MFSDDDDNNVSESGVSNFYNNNKVLIWVFGGILLFILIMSLVNKSGGSSEDTEELEYKIEIEPKEIVVSVDNSTPIIASVTNNPKAEISFELEDDTIASINNGNVKGLRIGETTATAKYVHKEQDEKTAAVTIKVVEGDPDIKLTDVSFKEGDLFMPVNTTYTISPVISPPRGRIEAKSYTSSNTNVVKVDEKGVVTSVGEGQATITLNVNKGEFVKELQVYVSYDQTKPEIIVAPKTIMLDGELRKVKVGSSEKLSYTVMPENADTDKLTWTSSNEEVVTVSETGRIKALKEGRATITVTSVTGESDQIDIEVESDIIEVTSIDLSVNEISLTTETSQTLMPVISPADASNKALSYMVLDSSIVSALPNETGTQVTLTGVSVGSTTLVISSSNNVEKRVTVTVTGTGGNNNNNSNSNNNNNSSDYDDKTIVVRSADNNLAKSFDSVKNMYAKGPSTVTITIHGGLSKIKYCLVKYNGIDCVPNQEMVTTGTVSVPSGDYYLLCIKKYDNSGNEVSSSSENYSSGVLHYYINTKGNGASVSTSTSSSTSSCSGSGQYTSLNICQKTEQVDCILSNGCWIKKPCNKYSVTTCPSRCKKTSTGCEEKSSSSSSSSSQTTAPQTPKSTSDISACVSRCIASGGTTSGCITQCNATPAPTNQTCEDLCKNNGAYYNYCMTMCLGYTYPTTAPSSSNKPDLSCNKPSNLNVDNDGKVTWTNSSNATKYQISLDQDTWDNITNGGSYKNKILAVPSGTVTVYLRSVCTVSGKNVYSEAISYEPSIVTIKIERLDGTGKLLELPGLKNITGSGNYFKGSTANLVATLETGYMISWYTKDSSGKATLVASSNSYTFTAGANEKNNTIYVSTNAKEQIKNISWKINGKTGKYSFYATDKDGKSIDIKWEAVSNIQSDGTPTKGAESASAKVKIINKNNKADTKEYSFNLTPLPLQIKFRDDHLWAIQTLFFYPIAVLDKMMTQFNETSGLYVCYQVLDRKEDAASTSCISSSNASNYTTPASEGKTAQSSKCENNRVSWIKMEKTGVVYKQRNWDANCQAFEFGNYKKYSLYIEIAGIDSTTGTVYSRKFVTDKISEYHNAKTISSVKVSEVGKPSWME